ncbi:zinc finger fyve phd-type protein [Stemphylium lycopersici]|nr:zinc finger fyve phd-type protein [Stemphylium lycopersici]
MVVLVDLDDDEAPLFQQAAPHASGLLNVKPLHHSLMNNAAATSTTTAVERSEQSVEAIDQRPNPNMNGFSAALSCYPQLVKHTLHCDNEDVDLGEKPGLRLHEGRHGMALEGRLTTGRVGKCARDMVGDCQRCGTIVCRNCTMKPPPTPTLRARHRRLCRTCTKAPLPLLMAVQKPRASFDSSPPASPNPRPVLFDSDMPRAFTTPAFERTPCNCDNVVWLCAPCGKDLRNADTMYVRGWSWRTRYSHYLGGVGTGAGEGNEGVECGRGSACLGARVVEHETCEQDLLDTIERSHTPSPKSPERWRGGTCYLTQEIEGIGGVLKVKHKKQVRVGECVKLYEDEKEKSIQYLEREVKGDLRSWCSWCERVVIGKRDKAEIAGVRPTSSGSSSASSTKSKPSYRY